MTIAGIVKKYRKMKKLSQEELADQLGCARPYISNFERGTAYPGKTIAARLAKLTGFNPAMLLEMIERERIETKIERLQERLRA